MSYPMYNNQMYMNDLQQMRDRIDNQMRQMQNQPMQNQPANITQNFQLQPQNQNNNDFDGKLAQNFDEVKNTLAFKNTLFVDKDMKLLWLKDTLGNIRTFSLQEIIEQDPKDAEISDLKREIQELKSLLLNPIVPSQKENVPIQEIKPKAKSKE